MSVLIPLECFLIVAYFVGLLHFTIKSHKDTVVGGATERRTDEGCELLVLSANIISAHQR